MYVRNLLVDKYGEDMVENGGLSVVTTLDYRLQLMAERAVADEVNGLARLNVNNGAALVINPVSGEILAMVGSKDYFNRQDDGNVNVLTRLRQPGSSIKLVNYAYALSHGYNASTILKDSPITFSVAGSPPYSPKDYDGKFRGELTLRSAFAESRNVPAVRVLASYGVNNMVEMGRLMGIVDWKDASDYGLSLTLGGGDVQMINLVRAYATVANYGNKPQIVSISKISDHDGSIIYANNCLTKGVIRVAQAKEYNECRNTSIIDARVAFILIDILRDNKARTPAFGSNSKLIIAGHPEVAVKTGTSNSLRDNVAIGFNQKYLVAAWVGNNDNTPMSRVASGVTGATPIWNTIMTNLLSDEPSQAWEVPQGLTRTNMCGTYDEWYLNENLDNFNCSSIKRQPLEDEQNKDNKDKNNKDNKHGEIL
jgi:membrane carboxypeptidase/penicillin-binding protein